VDGLAVCPVVGTPAARRIFAAVRSGAETAPVIAAVLDMLASVAAERMAPTPPLAVAE
jgi:hypothetical protein